MRRRRLGLLAACVVVALAASGLLVGCAVAPGYYIQAAAGQLELLRRAQPIADLQADPATPPALRARLDLVVQLRRFGVRELGLPDTGGFQRYADLQRPYVVWNVFAADPVSVRPKEWCVPVAGCIGYLGYFGEADAQAHAARLRAEGWDVYVAGIPAYSTLGWFHDPVLNTYIQWPETELARMIFHELAHQIVYVQDDTEFNESFATAVEEAGVRRWMAQPGKEALQAGFARSQLMRADFATLVLDTRTQLEALYASDLPRADKLARKQALIAHMVTRYHDLRATRWGGTAAYAQWFAQDLNNATLASVGLYHRWVPAFAHVLAQAPQGHLETAYAQIKALAAQPKETRNAQLAQWAALAPSQLP